MHWTHATKGFEKPRTQTVISISVIMAKKWTINSKFSKRPHEHYPSIIHLFFFSCFSIFQIILKKLTHFSRVFLPAKRSENLRKKRKEKKRKTPSRRHLIFQYWKSSFFITLPCLLQYKWESNQKTHLTTSESLLLSTLTSSSLFCMQEPNVQTVRIFWRRNIPVVS